MVRNFMVFADRLAVAKIRIMGFSIFNYRLSVGMVPSERN